MIPSREEVTEEVHGAQPASKTVSTERISISKRVTDHLANERTFLAWVRTGLSVMAFGFVVERFGLLLRELGAKGGTVSIAIPIHYSSLLGIALTLLGIAMMLVALLNFLYVRRTIDVECFRPRAGFAIALTGMASLIGVLLAIYLLVTT